MAIASRISRSAGSGRSCLMKRSSASFSFVSGSELATMPNPAHPASKNETTNPNNPCLSMKTSLEPYNVHDEGRPACGASLSIVGLERSLAKRLQHQAQPCVLNGEERCAHDAKNDEMPCVRPLPRKNHADHLKYDYGTGDCAQQHKCGDLDLRPASNCGIGKGEPLPRCPDHPQDTPRPKCEAPKRR